MEGVRLGVGTPLKGLSRMFLAAQAFPGLAGRSPDGRQAALPIVVPAGKVATLPLFFFLGNIAGWFGDATFRRRWHRRVG